MDAQQVWYRRALGLHEVVEEFRLDEPAVRTVVLRSGLGTCLELIECASASRHRAYADLLDAQAPRGLGIGGVGPRP